MLNHSGLHYGKLGLWDPRTDMTILDQKKIDTQSQVIGIPNLMDVTLIHEQSHRGFYRSNILSDITSLNLIANLGMAAGEKFLAKDKFETVIEHNQIAVRVHHMLNDLDPIMDTFFAYHFYDAIKRLNINPTDRALRILASNLTNQTSKKFFYQLQELYDKCSILNSEKSFMLPVFIISSVLTFGLIPLLKQSNEPEIFYPSKIFQFLVDSLNHIYNKNQKLFSDIFHKITKFQWDVELLDTLANQNTIDHDKKEIPPFRKRDNKNRRVCYRMLTNLLLYTKFPRMEPRELIEQSSTFLILVSGKDVVLRTRKHIPSKKKVYLHSNLVMTHAQDCIFRKKNVECFLCKYEPELCHSDYHKMIKNIEENLIPA